MRMGELAIALTWIPSQAQQTTATPLRPQPTASTWNGKRSTPSDATMMIDTGPAERDLDVADNKLSVYAASK